MSLRFKGADLRPVLTEAIANQGSSQKTEKNRTLRACEGGGEKPDQAARAAGLVVKSALIEDAPVDPLAELWGK